MGMSVEEMVNAVVKRITVTQLGDTALNPEKAQQLVRELELSTPMLEQTRRINMRSDKKDIDRVGFRERIMGPAPNEGEDTTTTSTPEWNQNQLSVVKAVAVVELGDEALEDNIEREDFESTLLSLIGGQAGIDLEELYLQGDTDSGDTYLALTDGWLKLAAHQLGDADYDQTDPEEMFEAALTELIDNNKEFMRRRNYLRFWTSWKAENDYRDVLRSRGTPLGDEAQTEDRPLAYKGIPVVPVFNMPVGDTLLSLPENQVYGIRRDIRMENDRKPRAGRTDFVVTFRTDAHYEDERGAVRVTDYVGPS